MAFHAVLLSLPPSILMLLLSYAGYAHTVSPMFMSAMQHLAAGLVMCAVAVELCPIVSAAPNDAPTILAIVVGFFGGVAIFLLLGTYCEVNEDEDEPGEPDDGETDGIQHRRGSAPTESSIDGVPAPVSGADGVAMLRDNLLSSRSIDKLRPRSHSAPAPTLSKAFGAKTSKLAQVRRLAKPARPPFPFAFAVTVCDA